MHRFSHLYIIEYHEDFPKFSFFKILFLANTNNWNKFELLNFIILRILNIYEYIENYFINVNPDFDAN